MTVGLFWELSIGFQMNSRQSKYHDPIGKVVILEFYLIIIRLYIIQNTCFVFKSWFIKSQNKKFSVINFKMHSPITESALLYSVQKH